MAKIKSCGFLVYRTAPTRSFLLMRHHDRWDLPKGHVDAGESKIQCAYRELLEETGITADAIRMDGRFKYKQRYVVPGERYGLSSPQEKTLVIYLAELIQPVEIIATEHMSYEWFDWNPPHAIQEKTVNPLLVEVNRFWQNQPPDSLS